MNTHEEITFQPMEPVSEKSVPEKRTKEEQRSELVNEIISRRQGFISKWALLIFGILLLLLALGASFIKYPDIVQGNAILRAENAPKEIITRMEGRLVKLFIKNEATVEKGQILGWLESTASYDEVIELSSRVESAINLVEKDKYENNSNIFSKSFHNLGEIQPAYQIFIEAQQLYNDYLNTGYFEKKRLTLQKNLAFLKKHHEILLRQKELAVQDVQLTQETFDSNNSLYQEKVISKQEIRDHKSRLTLKLQDVPQFESSILLNENQQIEKLNEIDELERDFYHQKLQFLQSLSTIKSKIDDWSIRYILKSPAHGKIVFMFPIQENQFLPNAKVIGFVSPPNTKYYVEVNLPQINSGKIELGQKVQLRFDAYPYQEFGYIEGKLAYISKVATDSGFLATVDLPDGLFTNTKYAIQYKNGLRSQALVLTMDAPILYRLYYKIIKLVNDK